MKIFFVGRKFCRRDAADGRERRPPPSDALLRSSKNAALKTRGRTCHLKSSSFDNQSRHELTSCGRYTHVFFLIDGRSRSAHTTDVRTGWGGGTGKKNFQPRKRRKKKKILTFKFLVDTSAAAGSLGRPAPTRLPGKRRYVRSLVPSSAVVAAAPPRGFLDSRPSPVPLTAAIAVRDVVFTVSYEISFHNDLRTVQ